MATKFSEVQASPEFQSLNAGQQNAVKSRFFNNVVAKDPSFAALDSQGQQALRTRFFGAQALTPLQQQFGGQPSAISAREPTIGERVTTAIPALQGIEFGGGPIEQFAERKGEAFARGVREEGPLFVGETVGELAGSKFGAKGRILGAGVGRATADAMVQIAQQIIGSPNAPQSSKDAAKRLLVQFSIGAGSEAVGEAAIGTGRRIAAPFTKRTIIKKPIPDIDDLKKLAGQAGIDFDAFTTPAQRTVSRGIDTFEEMAENAFFGRGRIRDIKEITQPAGIRKLTDRLLDSALPQAQRVGRGELGDILNDVVLGREKTFRRTGGALYKRVDDLTKPAIKRRTISETKQGLALSLGGLVPTTETTKRIVSREVGGAKVDLRPMKRFAEAMRKQRIKEGGTRKAIDDVISDVLARPDSANFQVAHGIRSDFLDTVRNATSKKDKAVGVAKRASSMIDRQMENAARNLSPDALRAWRTANAFWKTGKKTFNSQVVRRVTKTIANETPDKIVEAVFARKSPTQIRAVMKLADPLTQRRLRFAFLEDLLDKSSRQIPGDVSDLRTLIGGTFIENFDKLGDETLDAAFGKELKNRIRNTARIAKITQGKTGGAGGFLIQLIQAGPIAGAAGGVVTGQPQLAKRGIAAAVPLAGFTQLSSLIISSPKASRLLTDVMKMKPGTRQFTLAVGRLSRSIATEKRKANQREAQRQREQAKQLGLARPSL